MQSNTRGIAWKTGTRCGYRDAWSLGVGADYTVGVWVGRPDGTPMPGHYGAVTAGRCTLPGGHWRCIGGCLPMVSRAAGCRHWTRRAPGNGPAGGALSASAASPAAPGFAAVPTLRCPGVSLKVLGAAGRIHWLVDGRVRQSSAPARIFTQRFAATGALRVAALDGSGSHSSVALKVH